MSQKRRKHVPLRTCIGCQQKRPKRDLIRVVRTPAGAIEIDLRGKSSGRGAYLCPDRRCLEMALEQRKLSRALKCRVGIEDVSSLQSSVNMLLAEKETEGPTDPVNTCGSAEIGLVVKGEM